MDIPQALHSSLTSFWKIGLAISIGKFLARRLESPNFQKLDILESFHSVVKKGPNNHRAGWYRLAGYQVSVIVARLLELYIHGRIYDPGMGPYHPWVRRDIDDDPESRVNLKILGGVGFSTPCGAVSTQGMPVIVHRLLEL